MGAGGASMAKSDGIYTGHGISRMLTFSGGGVTGRDLDDFGNWRRNSSRRGTESAGKGWVMVQMKDAGHYPDRATCRKWQVSGTSGFLGSWMERACATVSLARPAGECLMIEMRACGKAAWD